MAKNFSRSDFISALCGMEAWAISPDWARTLRGWATMEDFNPSAIVTQAGEQYGSGLSRTSTRDGIGIMQVRGPLFTHENFMSWLFGFDTYESLATDFESMVNDGNVKGIVLNFHSPGGLVAGGSDLAQRIFDARGTKPQGIVSRAGGDMASMAYWLGSSAESVHVAPTGIVGSIGTVVQFQQSDPGSVEIVSDQSPNKRPDLTTPEGVAEVKGILNSLSDVFISNVARNRGVPVDTVVNQFGRGGVKVGQAAVDAGMADSVTTFDATFSSVQSKPNQELTMSVNPSGATAPTAAPAPAVAPAATAPIASTAAPAVSSPSADSGVQAERERITGILAAFEGTAFSGDATGFIRDGKSVADAHGYALGKLKAEGPKASTVTPASLLQESASALTAAASQGSSQDTTEAQTKAVFSAMTNGANGYRRRVGGANVGNRFTPPTVAR